MMMMVMMVMMGVVGQSNRRKRLSDEVLSVVSAERSTASCTAASLSLGSARRISLRSGGERKDQEEEEKKKTTKRNDMQVDDHES